MIVVKFKKCEDCSAWDEFLSLVRNKKDIDEAAFLTCQGCQSEKKDMTEIEIEEKEEEFQ